MSQLMDLYLKAINEDSSLRFDAEKRIDEVRKCDEALKGKQHKLDVDKDGKIEGEDLAKLRAMKEEEELNLEDFSLEELQDFMVSEDFQQLDELSKTTLGNYVKKASKSAVTATDIASREDEKRPFSTRSIKNYQLADRRQKGISKAVSRLTKEETEQLDELSKETLGKYIKKSSQYRGYHGMDAGAAGYRSKDQKDAIDKMGRRQRGVEKAVGKLTKESIEATVSEDFEQLDELSKKTLGKYIKKAAFRVGIHGMNAGEAKVGSKENKVANDKMGKRYMGILKAADKLANEEVELEEMTKAQMDKREDYVKGMKKNYKDFVSKYGTRAKDVMYATATKMAMKEELDEELNLEDYSLEELQDFMVSEDFEQLDELSKETLGNYVKKASTDYGNKRVSANQYRNYATKGTTSQRFMTGKAATDAEEKASKRQKGISKAVNRLTKEETELNLEDYSLEELQDFMVSEDFEQLDELSKETLASYIGKASKAYAKHDKQLGLADKANWGKISREDRQKYDKNVRKVSGNKGSLDTNDYDTHDSYHLGKLVKREKGISKAVGKLTKESIEAMVSEDFEQLDELSKDTLNRYFKAARASSNVHAYHGENIYDAHVKGYHTKKSKAARAAAKPSAEYQRIKDKVGDKDLAAQRYHDKKRLDRQKGISKAANKLANEETELNLEDYSLEELQDFMVSEDFEQLDEISKKVLGSYVKKASVDYAHNKLKGDEATAEKRRAGVKAAKIKLHKGEDDGKAGITETAELEEGQKIKTATGYIHKGSYGSEYDTDDEGSENKKDESEVKRGRGRPRKGADTNGNVKKYAVSSLLNRLMK